MESLTPYIPVVIVIGVWIGVALLGGRRLKKLEQSVVTDDSRPAGHLTLIRKVDATNAARKFKILVDDELVDRISAGETKHIKLSAGPHQIAIQVDWCKTEPFPVVIDDSQNSALVCGSTHNDWKCMFMFVIDPKNYLYVNETS